MLHSYAYLEALEMEGAGWVILLKRKQDVRRYRRPGNYRIKVQCGFRSLQELALLIH